MAIKNQIQFRRGSSSDWIAISGGNGPTLYAGEPGFDSTNNILKIGDGSTNWLNLKPILNINGAGATNNQYLIYNSTTGLWTPTSSGIFNNVYVSGNVGIGIDPPEYKLQVNGSFGATTKSFRINHPSKSNYTLEYGSLESPYHGVRLTGRGTVVKGACVVVLPDYLKDLIHDDDNINIQLTNIKHCKTLYVSGIDLENNQFTVRANRAKTVGDLEFFWTLTGVRKDVESLVVEKEK